MPIKKIHRYIAVCDVCHEPMRLGTDSEIEYTPNYPTRQDAQTAVDDNEWTDLGRGRIACLVSDPAHDDARDAAAHSRATEQPGTPVTRHVHVAITNPDRHTANRAALSLVDWITAEFPGHTVVTDAREWPGTEAAGQ